MPNPYFRFKQFNVRQDKAAMKVCTDSCLFGAWIAGEISKQTPPSAILDVGAGTGLLSLMLAQKCSNACIDAVEPDEPSAQQARNNFALSEWNERLHVHECRVQDFTTEKKYDFVISNPPFYENGLTGQDEAKNMAHHSTGLRLRDLMNSFTTLLSADGNFAVLLPYHRAKGFEIIANDAHYFINKKVHVKQTEQHSYFRSMLIFSREKKCTCKKKYL